jgi:hypothetical protein
MTRACSTNWEEAEHAYRLLVAKLEEKRTLGRSRARHSIKMDLADIGWTGLAQDRGTWKAAVNPVMNLQVP